MNLNATLRAFLIERSLPWLLDLNFFLAIFANPRVAGCVGLLDRTLRMNAITRIGSFSTDGAKILDGLLNNGNWFENAHEAPIAKKPDKCPPVEPAVLLSL
jgi:hypothetical protein